MLDRADAPDVHANARVKLERLAARSRLRVAKHHPDFFSDLVRENATRARFRDERSQLSQRRAHEPRLRADRDVADLSFQFRFRDESRNGIEDDHVERV